MPIEITDSNFPLEAISAVSDVPRASAIGSGGNRRNSSGQNPQDQDGDEETTSHSSHTDAISEAAILTLSSAGLEQEAATELFPVVSLPYVAEEEEQVTHINEMA